MGGGGVVCGQVQKLLCGRREKEIGCRGIALGRLSPKEEEYCACVTFPIK